ncbi:MAG: AbrB/MazE/SpoVT family DNA-binding domain-containing protein [Lacrimispora sphenoides]
MKTTGIIRRVDDLGRIVIPREIRRNLCFQEGSPVELFTDGDKLVIQKYQTCDSISDTVKTLRDLIVDYSDEFSHDRLSSLLEQVDALEGILKAARKL